MKQTTVTIASVIAGFALSIVALSVLWVGTPWPYQFLLALPIALVAWAARRWGGSGLPVLAGMAPVALLFVQFRDKNDSHLMPVLLVCAWVGASLLGHALRQRSPRRPGEAGPPPP